jgi:glycosyltransferase involved in cell wall biosynthesis
MAVGVPVVSTDLPFLESVGDAVLVANDPDGFVKCIEQALSEDKSIEVHNRIELARNNSWAERAKSLVNYLEKVEAENGKQ